MINKADSIEVDEFVSGLGLSENSKTKWNNLVKPFCLPEGMSLILGDVSVGSDTPSMVSKVLSWKKSTAPDFKLWKDIDNMNNQVKILLDQLVVMMKNNETSMQQINKCSESSSEDWFNVGEVGKLLLCIHDAFKSCRKLLKEMGDCAQVPIEPDAQSRLCDATMNIPGVLAAGVPGAGGFDAIFAIVLSKSARERVEKLWFEWKKDDMNVLPLVVQEDARGVRKLPSKDQIVIVATGGTIDKDYPKLTGGYAFEICDPAASHILECVPGYLACVVSVLKKDSLEITKQDRELICNFIERCGAKKIVITHGTDTMIETGQFLDAMCKSNNIIIVLTGSKLPERFKGSDASFNLGFAMGCCNSINNSGAYIAMSGVLIPCQFAIRDLKTGGFIDKRKKRC